MNINLFLLNETIELTDFEKFKSGMTELISINKEDNDMFLKHESIYQLDIFVQLYSNFDYVEQTISKFIEQLSPIERYIENETNFDQCYPRDGNAFMGIVFDESGISHEKQIIDNHSFKSFKNQFYSNFKAQGDLEIMAKALKYLFPDFLFEDQALEDVTYWNKENFDLYLRLLSLFDDIPVNPFQGGIGKTEVLKHLDGLASKRLDGEHRVTYRFMMEEIKIIRCKGHY